jgi:hypothetical protein
MTARLIEVRPAPGDYVRVIDSGRGCWAAGCDWDGELQGPAGAGMYRVHYKGRFADVAIEPDWHTSWPVGAVHWRELVPVPRDGCRVLPRVGDEHSWTVHLVLFSVTAGDALTFDAYHLVILFNAPPAAPEPPELEQVPEYCEPPARADLLYRLEAPQRYAQLVERIEAQNQRRIACYQSYLEHYERRLANYDPKYTRCWIRWCYSSHSFIPVCDPAKLRMLKAALPDGRVETPLFD